MQYNLHLIVKNWELSGTGKGAACTREEQDKRDKDDPDWGKIETFNGLNIVNFLPEHMKKHDYLLYFWHRLEKENLV